MTRVLLDTNLYIDWLRSGRHQDLMIGRDLVRYLSAVVFMELRAGARTTAAKRAIRQIARAYEAAGRIVAPTTSQFEIAGLLLQRLKLQGVEVGRASLVSDVLIALTARGIGAALYTRNAGDFEAVRRLCTFELQVVPG